MEDHTVDVMISMRNTLLQRLDKHLKRLGEGNRSAWIRRSALNLMRAEQNDIDLDGE